MSLKFNSIGHWGYLILHNDDGSARDAIFYARIYFSVNLFYIMWSLGQLAELTVGWTDKFTYIHMHVGLKWHSIHL